MKLFKICFWVYVALLPQFMAAQVTVTGTVLDPNGNPYANGTASAYSLTNSGQVGTTTTPVGTTSAGFFSMVIPTNTYIFTICAPPTPLGPTANPTPKQICFTSQPIPITITGDISSQLNAVAAVLGPKGTGDGGAAVIGTPGTISTTPVGSQVQINATNPFNVGNVVSTGQGSFGNGANEISVLGFTPDPFGLCQYSFVASSGINQLCSIGDFLYWGPGLGQFNQHVLTYQDYPNIQTGQTQTWNQALNGGTGGWQVSTGLTLPTNNTGNAALSRTPSILNNSPAIPNTAWVKNQGPPMRHILALSAPIVTGNSSAQAINETMPAWVSGTQYYGQTGVRGNGGQHGDQVTSGGNGSCATSGALYAFRNTGGDIPSASVTPTGCSVGATTTDGNGTWTMGKIVSFNCNTSIQIAANVLTCTSTNTLNVAGVGLANNQTIFFGNFVGASFLNENFCQITPSSITANTFQCPFTHANYGPTADTGTAYNSPNMATWVTDDFYLHTLYSGFLNDVENSINWSAIDTSSTCPGACTPPANAAATVASPSVNDTAFTAFVTDVNTRPWMQIAEILSHSTRGGNGINSNTPAYVAGQAAANAAALATPCSVNTTYYYHFTCSDGTNFEQMTSTGANAICVSGATIPAWGATTTFGTCTFTRGNLISGNAPLQEFTSCASQTGNTNTSFLNSGVYTTVTANAANPACGTGGNGNGTCTEADMVTLEPIHSETTDSYYRHLFDQGWIQHELATYPGRIRYFRIGDTSLGQSFPDCGAVIQGAGFANTGTGVPWINFWTGWVINLDYAFDAQLATTLTLGNMIEVSPQGSPNVNDSVDPTILADIEAEGADRLGRISTSFNGLQQTDMHTYETGGTTAADWTTNIVTHGGNNPNASVQFITPGSCINAAGAGGPLDTLTNFAAQFPVQNFEEYSNDWNGANPNSLDFATCGQRYLGAMRTFQYPPAAQTAILPQSNCQLGGAAGTTSPAACGGARTGKIALPSSVTTYTVNDVYITANSQITIQQTTDNSGLPSSPTCSGTALNPVQSSRSVGNSFTFTTTSVASVTCIVYAIQNFD